MTSFTWSTGVSGDWSTRADWSPTGVPHGSGDDATIPASPFSQTVTVSVAESVGSLTIGVPDVTLAIGAGAGFTLFGNALNIGTISISNNAGNGVLEFGSANGTLSGGGTISLGDSASASEAVIEGGGATIDNIDNKIVGFGLLGNNSTLFFTNEAAGVIDATGNTNGGIVINTAAALFRNKGLIETTGSGTLQILSFIDNNGGTIAATGGNITLNGATISGGTLATSGSGKIDLAGAAALVGSAGSVTNLGTVADAGNQLQLFGTIVNEGTILATGSGAEVTLSEGLLVNAAGALLAGTYFGASLGPGAAVSNAGTIDGLTIDALSLLNGGSVDNTGTIVGYSVGVNVAQSAGTITNAGIISATASNGTGASLYAGLLVNSAGGSISATGDGVDFSHAGNASNSGTIESVSGTGVRLFDGGSLYNSGHIAGIRGVYLNGGAATVTNLGTIVGAINAVEIRGAAGSGETLVNSGLISATGIYDAIYSLGGNFTNAAGGTIVGSGGGIDVGQSAGTVVNLGIISASSSGAAVALAGGRLVNSAGGRLLGVADGADVGSAGTVVNSGTIDGVGHYGVRLFNGGSVDNTGTIAGYSVGIDVAQSAGAVSNAGAISVTASNGIGVSLYAGLLVNSAGGSISAIGTGVGLVHAATAKNSGTIESVSGTGLRLYDGGSLYNSGRIAGAIGVYLNGGAATVTNLGTIAGVTGALAIRSTAGSAERVVNSGVIYATGNYNAIYAIGGNFTNAASGLIVGKAAGIDIGQSAGTVINLGTISGTGDGVAVTLDGGLLVNSGGALIAGAVDGAGLDAVGSVNNSGVIHGAGGYGLRLFHGGSVDNTGVISGASDGIHSDSAGAVNNFGTVSGGNGISDGSGVVVNSGLVSASTGTGVYVGGGGGVTNANTGLIVGYGDGVHTGPTSASVLNLGTIEGTGLTAFGVDLGAAGTLTNSGVISAINISGPAAVYVVSGGFVDNFSAIGSSDVAVHLVRGGTIVNETGGILQGSNVAGIVVEGAGVAGRIVNFGTILGGEDGIGSKLPGDVLSNTGLISGTTFAGVYLYAGGTLTNAAGGLIQGYRGVWGTHSAGTVFNSGVIIGTSSNGPGVELTIAGSTLTNAGTIVGSGGAAVAFFGGGNRLIVDPGAVFSGTVIGAGTGNVLELAAGGPGVLDGVGTAVTGFDRIVADAAASWQLTGPTTLVGGVTLVNSGTLTIAGSLVNDGLVEIGGTLVLDGTATGGGAILFDPGELVISGAGMPANVISGLAPGDVIDIRSLAWSAGNTATLNGNTLSVSGGGNTVDHLTVGGVSGVSRFAAFDDGHGGTGVLAVATATWTNAAGGGWNTSSNWSTNAVPGSGDDAVIGVAGGYTVNLVTETDLANSLTINDTQATVEVRGTRLDLGAGGLANSGTFNVDVFGGDGNSVVTISGAFVNTSAVTIGNGALTGTTTVTADSLVNSGASASLALQGNIGAGTTHEADLVVSSGAPSQVTTFLRVGGDADLDFASGGITSIAAGGWLELDGAQARISDGAATSSTALTGLSSNSGTFVMRGNNNLGAGGAVVSATGNFANSATFVVDDLGGDGGSQLTIDGTFTNTSAATIGNGALSADTTVAVGGLVNSGSNGQLALQGNIGAGATQQATLVDGGAAPSQVTAFIRVGGDADLEFATGSIASIAAGGWLELDGAQARISDGAATSSTALTGLASNSGTFLLRGNNNLGAGGAVVSATGNFANSATFVVDDLGGDGGTQLTFGGSFVNTSAATIGNGSLSADTTVSAGGLLNSGTNASLTLQGNVGAGATQQATFAVGGQPQPQITGFNRVGGDADLEFSTLFGVTGITSIAAGGWLELDGAEARISLGAATSSTALTGLASNSGTFLLRGNSNLGAGGAVVSTTVGFANSASFGIDDLGGDGGSQLTIGGTFTNTSAATIGNGSLSADTTVSAGSLVNSGTNASLSLQGNTGAGATQQATLAISAGAPPQVQGFIRVGGDADLIFNPGLDGFTSIAAGGWLEVDGAEARVSLGASTSNTGLVRLASNSGTFLLRGNNNLGTGGAVVSTTLDFANSASFRVDDLGGDGGSQLTISGTFTNISAVTIGNGSLSADTTVSAGGLVNSGTNAGISVQGNTAAGSADQATLTVGQAAPSQVQGFFRVGGDADLEFASGSINSIAAGGGWLELDGSAARISDGAATSSTALTGLSSNSGTFLLRGNNNLGTGGAAVSLNANFDNSGTFRIDDLGGDGGSQFTVSAGAFFNTSAVTIGNGSLSADTTVAVQGWEQIGANASLNLQGNVGAGATQQATLAEAGQAMLQLGGFNRVGGDADLEFTTGSINSILAGGWLELDGSEARISDGAATSSTALTGLASNSGTFLLRGNSNLGAGGAVVSTTVGFANSATFRVDDLGGDGGTQLTIGGTLTNTSAATIGNGSLSAATTVAVGGLANSGSIQLQGNTGNSTHSATLDIAGAGTDTGTIFLGLAAVLSAGSLLVDGGGRITVGGGTATGVVVGNGGSAIIGAAGVIVAPVISGGLLDYQGGATASGAVTFQGSGGTLEIDGALAAGVIQPNMTVFGVAAGDSFDFTGIPFSAPNSAGFDAAAANPQITFTEGGNTYEIRVDPAATAATFSGDTFVLSADGTGSGTALKIIGGGGPGANFASTNSGIVLSSTTQNPATVISGASITNITANHGGDAVYGTNAAAWNFTNSGTIVATSNSIGILFEGGGTVTNRGTIAGNTSILLETTGKVFNSGAMTGISLAGGYVENASGATIVGSGIGIFANGGTCDIVNFGTIFGTGTLSFGVFLDNGGSVTNTGTIADTETTGTGVVLNDGGAVMNGGTIAGVVNAVSVNAATGTIFNSGAIVANGTNTAIALHAGGDVENAAAGSIRGSNIAININGGAGTVVNLGTIAGAGTNSAAVNFGAGGGIVTNGTSGVITGYHIGVGFFPGTAPNPGMVTIVNRGQIVSTQTGTAAGTGFNGWAVQFGTAGTGFVDNFGLISNAQTNGGGGILMQAGGSVTNEAGGNIISPGGNGISFSSGGGAGTVVNLGFIENAATGHGTVYLGAGGSVTNGDASHTSATIQGTGNAVTIHPLAGTVTNFGTIAHVGAGTAGEAVYLASGFVINYGLLTGAAPGTPAANGTGGYPGVVEVGTFGTGTVVNFGTITTTDSNGVNFDDGGRIQNGSATDKTAVIYGRHRGIYIGGQHGVPKPGAAGTVVNWGTIANGNTTAATIQLAQGGIVTNYNLIASDRTGIAFNNIAGTIDNAGTIVSTAPTSFTAGAGVYLEAGGLITNENPGVITAIRGAVSLGGTTAVAATVVNNGIIDGSVGITVNAADTAGNTVVNAGSIVGGSGVAVRLQGAGNRVAIDPGAVFGGTVSGGGGGNDTLELRSSENTGTLAGFGSQYVGFDQVIVDPGANWVATGPVTIDAGTTVIDQGTLSFTGGLVDNGFVSGAHIANGTETVGSGGVDVGATIGSGGLQDVFGTASATLLVDGGRQVVEQGGTAGGVVLDDGAVQTVSGTASGTTVSSGDTQVVAAGGVAVDTTIAGGVMDLQSGATASGTIAFSGVSGTLEIDGAQMPTTPIGGFAFTDTIDLRALGFSPALSASIHSGTLSITSGGTVVDQLTLTGVPDGTPFTLAGDNVAGTAISRGKPNIAYMTGSTDPWSANLGPSDPGSPDSAMNTAFGAGNWVKLQGFTASALTAGYQFIYIDGGDGDSSEFDQFITNNTAGLEHFVAAGGRLFINAARWVNNGSTGAAPAGDETINLGFGDVKLSQGYSNDGTALAITNPIFHGPHGETGSAWTGDWFSHDIVTGNGINLLIGGTSGVVLAGEHYGQGYVMFGGMTSPFFQSPQPQADDLRANILDYADGGGTGTVLPAPANLALSPASESGVPGSNDTNVTMPVITGTGQNGDTITLFDGDTVAGTGTVGTNGTWAVTTGVLADGIHSITATQSDNAGDLSPQSAPLSLTIDTSVPQTTPAALTVAPNAEATPIGIAAPSDANDGATALSVAVTGLPDNGTVTMGDGATAVTVGEQLSVAQLTQLDFVPEEADVGTQSSFTYTVSDPAGNAAVGTAALAVSGAQLYDFVFTYSDGKDYYVGTVSDDGSFGYAPGQTIATAAGSYDIEDVAGATTQAPGTVFVTSYSHNGPGEASSVPVDTAAGTPDSTSGLLNVSDAVLGTDGQQHPFSPTAEANFTTNSLFGFVFAYNDGSEFYTGTVAVAPGASPAIPSSAIGSYSVFAEGVTDRAAGTVVVDRFTIGNTSFLPNTGGAGAADGSSGLGSESDTIDVNGATFAFSDLVEPSVLLNLPLAPAIAAPSTDDVFLSEIDQIYSDVLGRIPDPSGIATYTELLANGTSPDAIREIVADSPEAANDLNQLYHQVFGRDIDQGGADTYTQLLKDGSSLAAIEVIIGQSPEAQNDLEQIYEQVLGREADAGGLLTYTGLLSNGVSLAAIRDIVADSPESTNDLNAMFQQIIGRQPDAAELAGMQAELRDGDSQAGLRDALSSNGTAGGFTTVLVGAGDQTMTAQPDTPTEFDFTNLNFGNDAINAFDTGEDAIRLPQSYANGLQESASNGSTVISFTGHSGQSILLSGVTPDRLSSANFHFVAQNA